MTSDLEISDFWKVRYCTSTLLQDSLSAIIDNFVVGFQASSKVQLRQLQQKVLRFPP